MTFIAAAIFLAVALLAYSNGANDNFKGVATLFGARVATYRSALAWATVTTGGGSLLALLLAQELIETFKGKGLVPNEIVQQPQFVLAVSSGAACTVLLATRFGMPISTTHALLGGLLGAGSLASAGQVQLSALLKTFLLPLLGSPVVALLGTTVLYGILHFARIRCGATTSTCLCVGETAPVPSVIPNGQLATVATTAENLQVTTGPSLQACRVQYDGRMLGCEVGPIVDGLHFLSAGAVGFARGLNDTPKIVALLLAGTLIEPTLGLAMVAVVMAIGGILNASRVAETMSHRITQMNPGQGLAANLMTSVLVLSASRFGLPVSTTHVSVGSLFGVGLVSGTANPRTILTILSAWATTLPLAACCAAIIYSLLRLLG